MKHENIDMKQRKKLLCRGCDKKTPKTQLYIYGLCQECRADRWGN